MGFERRARAEELCRYIARANVPPRTIHPSLQSRDIGYGNTDWSNAQQYFYGTFWFRNFVPLIPNDQWMRAHKPEGVFDYCPLSAQAEQAGWKQIITMGANPWYLDYLRNTLGYDEAKVQEYTAKPCCQIFLGVRMQNGAHRGV